MTRFLGLRGAKLGSVISAVCGLSFLCFGYAQGVMGGLLTVPAFLERFPQVDTINNSSAHNAKVQGAVVGTWNLGCFVSAILTIFLGDYLGRRKTLILGLSLWIVGEIVQCSSYGFGQFVAGRAIAGFGNGFTTSTVAAYQAECVKSHRKGTILMITAGVFIAFGLALSYWLVYAFAYLSSASASWRGPIAFQLIFALICLPLLFFLPESPRWLILTGREQEALTVLSALNDEDIDGPEIRDEFLQIKDAVLVMTQGTTSSLGSNKERRTFHRVVLAYFVQVFQQATGINMSLQYLAIMFFTQMSYTGSVSRLLGACAATEYFLASFIAVVGIDRFWGRRSLMMFGAGGMCLCMIMLTILIYLWHDHRVGGTNISAAVLLFGFNTFFAIGWQGMAWLYQVEVVPLRIRGPANALSTSANWLINFVIVFATPIIYHNITWRTYIIYSATNFAILPLIYFFYPETAYRSLEEVDVIFQLANEAPGNPWLNVVRISKTEPLWFGRRGEKDFKYEGSEWQRRFGGFEASSGTTLGSDAEKRSSLLDSTSSPRHDTTPDSPGSGSGSGSGNGSSQSQKKLIKKQHRKSKQSTTSTAAATSAASRARPAFKDGNESFHSARSAHSAHSAHSDPDWASSDLAPPPLRVPSRLSIFYTGTSRSPSIDYPGRLAYANNHGGIGTGIVRTSSGRETYLPDGVHHDEAGLAIGELDLPQLARPRPRSNSSSRGVPRDAGRAY